MLVKIIVTILIVVAFIVVIELLYRAEQVSRVKRKEYDQRFINNKRNGYDGW